MPEHKVRDLLLFNKFVRIVFISRKHCSGLFG